MCSGNIDRREIVEFVDKEINREKKKKDPILKILDYVNTKKD